MDIRAKWDTAVNAQRSEDISAAISLMFVKGIQRVRVSKDRTRFERVDPVGQGAPNLLMNICIKAFSNLRQNYLRSRPRTYVAPATPSEKDVSSAKIANALLRYFNDRDRMPEILTRIKDHQLLYGWAVAKVTYDPEKKAVLKGAAEPEAVGEVTVSTVSPFNFKMSPGAETWDEVQWVIERSLMTAAEAREMFGVEVEDSLVKTMPNEWTFVDGNSTAMERKGVEVLSYYERPCAEYPNGRYAVLVSDVAVQQPVCPSCRGLAGKGEDKYECPACGEKMDAPEGSFYIDLPYYSATKGAVDLPFVLAVCLPQVSNPRGMSYIEHLIPIQQFLNASGSIRAKAALDSANAPILSAVGEPMPQITGALNQVIHYNKVPPQRMMPPPVSNELHGLEQQLTVIADGIANTQTSQETARQGGSKTATALSLSYQEAAGKLTSPAESLGHMLVRVDKMRLELARVFYTEERTLKIVGEENTIEVKDFSAADLTSTDVRMVEGSELPKDPAIMLESIFQMMQYGSDKITAEQVQEAWEILFRSGQVEAAHEDHDKALANDENRRAQLNERLYVREFDHHQKHIQQHQRALAEMANIGSLEAKKTVMELSWHIKAHLAAGQVLAMPQDPESVMNMVPLFNPVTCIENEGWRQSRQGIQNDMDNAPVEAAFGQVVTQKIQEKLSKLSPPSSAQQQPAGPEGLTIGVPPQ